MLAGFRRPGDDAGLVVPLAVGLAVRGSDAATVSRWTRTGSGMTPGTGEPGRLDRGLGLHVGDLPERGITIRGVRPLDSGTAVPSLGTMLSVRSPFGVRPAVLCAKSLRRSAEMAL
jgi:hypothetical protein